MLQLSHTYNASISFLTHVFILLVFLLALAKTLKHKERLAYSLILAVALLMGFSLELLNDSYGGAAVSYPLPRVISIPFTKIPLSIVLGWAGFAVLIRLLTDRLVAWLPEKTHRLVKFVLFVVLLLSITFAIAFTVELFAVKHGVWVYFNMPGLLPILNGPVAWLILMCVVNIMAYAMFSAYSKLSNR